MTFSELRKKHPQLTFEKFNVEQGVDELLVTYHFHLDPDIHFATRVVFPLPGPTVDPIPSEGSIFALGLVELLSYWKCACPPRILVKCGNQTEAQQAFWRKLLRLGLGEFFFRNGIDPSADVVVDWEFSGPSFAPRVGPCSGDELLMVGGGKDSALALSLVSEMQHRAVVLNPIPAALRCVRTAGWQAPLIIRRTLSPELLKLNAAGYLNGHTPFSACLAFSAHVLGTFWNSSRVLVANEASANEANTSFRGIPINHQYSKSYEFEKDFREYTASALGDGPEYVSLLRPLNDLQVSALFARTPELHRAFRSCNVGQSDDRWCGRCAKCAFVYLTLYPFIGLKDARLIFGADLFQDESIQRYIRQLLGVEGHKPFECVGTLEESQAALVLAQQRARSDYSNGLLPGNLGTLINKEMRADARTLLMVWNDEHFVPRQYCTLLKEKLRAVIDNL